MSERRWVRFSTPCATSDETPVRGHLGQAHHAGRDRHRGPQVQDELRDADDRHVLAQLRRRERQAARARRAAGRGRGRWAASPRPTTGTRRCRRSPGDAAARSDPSRRAPDRGRRSAPARAVAVPRPGPGLRQPQLERHRAGHGERVGRPPAPRPRLRERFGIGPGPLEPGDGRLVLPAVVDVLEVAIEEAHELVQPVDVRARVGVVRERVDPVADQRPARGVDAPLLHPERGVDVGVAPARDLEHRALDGVVVRRERAAAPVRAVELLADPGEQPGWGALEAVAPLVAPALAAERRPGRHRVHPQLADGVLALVAGGDAAAADVDVVAVAIVGGVHRQDRAQVGRAQLRDLDRGEAAVADAPHADAAVAPRLRGQPLHGVEAVERLGLGVLVHGDAGRAAGPADVEPAQGEPPCGEPLAEGRVPVAAPVVLAVRDHLEDDGKALRRAAVARARPPDVRGQLDAVADRDPDVPVDLVVVDGLARRGRLFVGHGAEDTGSGRCYGEPSVPVK